MNRLRLFAPLCLAIAIGCAPAGPSPAESDGGVVLPEEDSGPVLIDGYPAGPYGLKTGQVFPNLTLRGRVGGAPGFTDLRLIDYFDPDGGRGVRALFLTVGAPWCEACVGQARSLPSAFATTYRGRGARILTALVQGSDSKPATDATVDAWVKSFSVGYDVAADPRLETVRMSPTESGSLSLPHDYLIDPRTMRIVGTQGGPIFTPTIVGLDELLRRNGG